MHYFLKLIVSDTLLQEYAAVVPFQMRLPKAAVVAIQVDKARAEDHGWTVSLESNTKVLLLSNCACSLNMTVHAVYK